MAGKPELSVTPQSQNQSVQNVVVYVSNDNIAQAYTVGHQNVPSSFQQNQGSSQQQNGAVVYTNNAQTIVPQTTNKTFKNQNNILENGSIANNFYVQNGFQHQQNITYQSQNQNLNLQNNQNIPVQNQTVPISNQNVSIANQNMQIQNQNLTVQNHTIPQNAHIQNQNLQLVSNGTISIQNQNIPSQNQNNGLQNQNIALHNQNIALQNPNIPPSSQNLQIQGPNVPVQSQNGHNPTLQDQHITVHSQMALQGQNISVHGQHMANTVQGHLHGQNVTLQAQNIGVQGQNTQNVQLQGQQMVQNIGHNMVLHNQNNVSHQNGSVMNQNVAVSNQNLQLQNHMALQNQNSNLNPLQNNTHNNIAITNGQHVSVSNQMALQNHISNLQNQNQALQNSQNGSHSQNNVQQSPGTLQGGQNIALNQIQNLQGQNVAISNQMTLQNNVHGQNVALQNQNLQLVSSFNGSSEVFALHQGRSENKRDESNPANSESYISTDSSSYVVMSAENGQNSGVSVVFPRCDSVRSDAAESSCSSLSSGDSQADVQALQQSNGDIVVYDNNGVSVNVRSTQNLGNLVLTMVPQGQQIGVSNQQQHQQNQTNQNSNSISNQITIPFGWKRIPTNGIVLYMSPSNTALSSLEQVKEYLTTEGTCKCGLECPLKYENVFNFDPKVSGKPYVISPDTNQGDLTKLCNHKRKLLAIGKPPTAQPALQLHIDPNKLRKDGGLKRKKRKVGPYAGVSVSQILAQREKTALNHQQPTIPYKEHQNSPQFIQQQQQQQWPPNVRPSFPEGQINPQNPGVHQLVRYSNQTGPINRIPGSPSGIAGQQMMIQNNPNQPNPSPQMQSANPQQMLYQHQNQQQIIGPNGQVLVQSGQNQQHVLIHGNQIQQRMSQGEVRSPNRVPNTGVGSPNLSQGEFGTKMHPQQRFYGQNIPYYNNLDQNKMQQQVYDHNKGPRPNFVPNNGNMPFQGYRTDQNQIPVAQNQHGMIMVAQNQQKNQHWNQNKPSTPQIQNQNQMVPIQNMSPHSQNSPQGQNPNPFERVPPLHHHTPPPPVWNEDISKRKSKGNKVSKKNRPYTDQQRFGNQESCPNVDVRSLNQDKSMGHDSYQSPGPSFMEDPSGYLAQQTALLNSTISRQTGVNNCQNYICHSPNLGSPAPQNQNTPTNKTQYSNRINVQSVQVVHKANESQNNLPDSSATENTFANEMNQRKSNQNQRSQIRVYQNPGSNSAPSTPNSSGFEDNPVTSSTFSEKYGQSYLASPDSRPIQGGTVSTSNGSPVDGQSSHSEPSSAPSTPTPVQQRNSDTPLMSVGTNPGATSICSTSAPNQQSGQKIEGYCPHPHAIGSNLGMPRLSTPFSGDMITITASGRTFGSNTITSVLAGRASTSTVSINAPVTIPTSSISSFNTSQSTGTMSQASGSKTPLEMVQSVVSSIQLPNNTQTNVVNTQLQQISPTQLVKSPQSLPPGHILVSSGGQLLMATTGNGQQNLMAPPPPKLVSNTSPMPPLSASQIMTNVTASVTQVIPAVAQQVLGQQTVLVNTLPTPFVIQPGVVTVDGMAVGQNMQIPHLVTGNVIQQQIQIDGGSDANRTPHHSPGFVSRQPVLLSPESKSKKGKKRKMSSSQTVASMLHLASQQSSNVMVQPSPQQSFQSNFQMAHSPQGLQTPMLQALTIVPGKPGVQSQIVMNGQQTGTGAFGQSIITNSQHAPQINLLQPVNLLNSAGVVQNFPTIQQFIVPNLGGMVMTADGTLIQDQNLGMQLQLQNVNGQNVLTQVQNSNVFTGGSGILAGTAGMVIRTPNGTQGKIIQQQHSPGAQFLSPNGGQFVMNGTQFNGQLSPLVANVSPTQGVTFSTSPQQVRPATSLPQEFIQCGQMGQTLMVPCTPTQTIAVTSASNQQNTTYVQQNTTIVQQQTTMVSNNQIQNIGGNQEQQNFIINNSPDKNGQIQSLILQRQSPKSLAMMRQSVSTQTAVKQNSQAPPVTTNTFCQTSMSTSASSPPDTTTHSPLAAGGQSPSNANADTTTYVGTGVCDEGLSPAPSNNSSGTGGYAEIAIQGRHSSTSMAMVHCVSSSEPDSGEICGTNNQTDMDWSHSFKTSEFTNDIDANNHSIHISRKPETPTHMAFVESSTVVSGMQLISSDNIKTQESIVSSRNYESTRNSLKRKHGDTLVIMETRHMQTALQDDEENSSEQTKTKENNFSIGDVVWGSANGCQNWPGKIVKFTDENEKALVHWFGGDKSSSMVEVTTLQTLTEGLDAHHRARKKCRKSRKLNPQLEKAIQEAMTEFDKEADGKLPEKNKNHNLNKQTAKSR